MNTSVLSNIAWRRGLASFLAAFLLALAGVTDAFAGLSNLSTRARIGINNDVMIGGFVIGGSTPKKVLVVVRGPTLAAFGVPGVIADPVLQLFSGQTLIASNGDWVLSTDQTAIQATGLAPSDVHESAILTTLNPGAYTAVVSGINGTTGVGIVEVFEMDNPGSPFVNLSTRAQVYTVNEVMIGGFVVSGSGPQTVLVRARGPSLAAAGVTGTLVDPVLQLFSGQTLVALNDNWGSASNVAAIQASGLAPTEALESAILVTLNPGAYTAIVSGSGGGVGMGIVEVFPLATAPVAPSATTSAASNITMTSATLNGIVGDNFATTTASFEYGLTTSYGTTAAATPGTIGTGSGNTPVSASIVGLVCSSTYNFRVKGVNSIGTTQGANLSFATASCPGAPSATTSPATAINKTGATLNGSVNDNGSATTVTFEYGLTTSYGTTAQATPSVVAALAGNTPASLTLSGLDCGTNYNFRIRGTSSLGTALGANQSFTTTGCSLSNPTPGKVYYLSPTGSDTNNGLSPAAPWKTFRKAFGAGAMVGGDELVLLDGTYSVAAGTGIINFVGTNSAQPPSGTSLSAMTYIHALNPGKVFVDGGGNHGIRLGTVTRKDSFIKIQGITFLGGGALYNVDWSTIKDCGFNGELLIGTNDHDMGNDNNLVEDAWVWATEIRHIAQNYRSKNNTWRRIVVRGDGCTSEKCMFDPNAGMTVYDSNNISIQNAIVADRILAPGAYAYGDFTVAQHTAIPKYYFGKTEWLGCMSINSPNSGFTIEPDKGNVIDPSGKIQNCVVWESTNYGIILNREGTNYTVDNVTVKVKSGNGIYVDSGLTSVSLRSAIVLGTGLSGVSSRFAPSFMDVFFATGAYNGSACTIGCFTSNPVTDTPGPSLKYLPRIESGSKLKGAGFGGSDIGANVVFRYGVDDARFGDPNYNTLSTVPLWPWPNEARIKAEMCATTTRGFCSTGTRLDGTSPVTLTSYIWEVLGNPIPAGIYPP